MMVENLAEGRKIFVIKSAEGHLTRPDTARIARALRARGPNWLLWVEPGRHPGRVRILEPGLA